MNPDVLARLKNASMLSEQEVQYDLVSTGSYALNKIISGKYNGGVPIGAITQFVGHASTAKTVFGTHILREAQKKGYYTVIVDTENAYSAEFAKTLGLDPDKLIYAAPPTLEASFKFIHDSINAIRSEDPNTPIVIFYDSIAVSPSEDEFFREAEDVVTEEDNKKKRSDNMDGAQRAKKTGSLLRKLNPHLRPKKVALVVVNQFRKDISGYRPTNTAAAGGNALEYYLALNLKTVKTDHIGPKHAPTGIRGEVINLKNKIHVPFRECDFELMFDEGINPYHGILPHLETDGVVERGGSWYTVKSTGKKFQSAHLQGLIEANDEGVKPITDLLKEE